MTKDTRKIERIQTGVRIEKRVLQVLKAIAARYDMGLGDLIEGIVLHSFEGKSPFDGDTLAFIEQMRPAFGLDLTAEDSHRLTEE
ncbi:MAG: hypothetical protein GY947_13705 [Rhodobacteraceae bacterium]|nr:hypothetical protein [Paracoccaceae bacterium]